MVVLILLGLARLIRQLSRRTLLTLIMISMISLSLQVKFVSVRTWNAVHRNVSRIGVSVGYQRAGRTSRRLNDKLHYYCSRCGAFTDIQNCPICGHHLLSKPYMRIKKTNELIFCGICQDRPAITVISGDAYCFVCTPYGG